MVHMPCTNCAAFGCECRIPEMRARKNSSAKRNNTAEPRGSPAAAKQRTQTAPGTAASQQEPATANESLSSGTPAQTAPVKSTLSQRDASSDWKALLNSQVRQGGSVAFLGSTSHLNLLLENTPGKESYHYSSVDEALVGLSRFHQMDRSEVEILKIKGAFLLPAQDLADELVECFFEKIHPLIPVVNRSRFMRQYNDPSNPPSLLLRQAIMTAASKVCRSKALEDEHGSTALATQTFYKRAKALYDANYEFDRLVVVQSLILLGWFHDAPEEVNKNVFYWTRVALTIAQGIGLHRSVESSGMPLAEKRMWKRIWWGLFVRDRFTAVAMGRPVMINLEDSDIPMITIDDFDESEPNKPSPYPVNREHALLFIQTVRLSEIMGLVLKQQYSVRAEHSRLANKIPDISQCDMALGAWINNLPQELKYSIQDKENHDFLKALLHSQYYTVLCLVHRSNILHRRLQPNGNVPSYPSWGIAFQAAHMIVRIMDNIRTLSDIRDCPAFTVYAMFSAMIMLIYQTESPQQAVVDSAKRSLASITDSLKEISTVYHTAQNIVKLAEFMATDKRIRDKIVRSAKRYAGIPPENMKNGGVGTPGTPDDAAGARVPQKRSRDDAGIGGPDNRAGLSPTPPLSYVRGTAPTPRPAGYSNERTSSRNTPYRYPQQPGPPQAQQPQGEAGDTGTPSSAAMLPDQLTLVTTTSPTNHSFLENFRPSQLFPESHDNYLKGPQSMNSDHTDSGANSDALFAVTDPFGEILTENEFGHSSDESVTGAPNNLNVGDWYQYLLNNTAPSTLEALSRRNSLGGDPTNGNNDEVENSTAALNE